jgi:hypothetical protein
MPMTPDLPQTEIAIVQMTNAFRQENKRGELRPNPVLQAAARAFAEYLAKTGKFAHEADGRDPQDRAVAQGYRYCLIAENLALNLDSRGFETRALAREAVEGWKNSPGHRANMLRPGLTEIGVAVARAPDKNPKFISVQMFGRPDAMKVQFRIENKGATPMRYTLGEKEHTVPGHTIITHTSCDAGQLGFGSAGGETRFEPRHGERFVVRTSAGGSVEVTRERK